MVACGGCCPGGCLWSLLPLSTLQLLQLREGSSEGRGLLNADLASLMLLPVPGQGGAWGWCLLVYPPATSGAGKLSLVTLLLLICRC